MDLLEEAVGLLEEELLHLKLEISFKFTRLKCKTIFDFTIDFSQKQLINRLKRSVERISLGFL